MLEPVPGGRQPRVRCRRCGWIGIRNAHGVTEEERAARRTTSPCPRCSHLPGLLEEALRVETEPLRRVAALDQLLRELHRLAAELHQGLARRQH
jgi:hypothetical protein